MRCLKGKSIERQLSKCTLRLTLHFGCPFSKRTTPASLWYIFNCPFPLKTSTAYVRTENLFLRLWLWRSVANEATTDVLVLPSRLSFTNWHRLKGGAVRAGKVLFHRLGDLRRGVCATSLMTLFVAAVAATVVAVFEAACRGLPLSSVVVDSEGICRMCLACIFASMLYSIFLGVFQQPKGRKVTQWNSNDSFWHESYRQASTPIPKRHLVQMIAVSRQGDEANSILCLA